jgi:putative endonuclease
VCLVTQGCKNAAAVWFVYVLVSTGGRTYVGIATDVARRLRQHNGELAGGARATRGHRPWAVGRVVGPVATRAAPRSSKRGSSGAAAVGGWRHIR